MLLDLPVRHFMSGDVVTVSPEASLTDALTAMTNGGFHHLPVVEGESVVGMLAMSDLLAIWKLQPPELKDTGVVLDVEHTVAQLMTARPAVLSIDAPLREAVLAFAEHGWHALPVVAGARLVGILTTRDLCRHLLSD